MSVGVPQDLRADCVPTNSAQSRIVATLSDTLLLKLLSGALSVAALDGLDFAV